MEIHPTEALTAHCSTWTASLLLRAPAAHPDKDRGPHIHGWLLSEVPHPDDT